MVPDQDQVEVAILPKRKCDLVASADKIGRDSQLCEIAL
jgi:hypothetical protein